MFLQNFYLKHGWNLVEILFISGSEKKLYPVSDLSLSDKSLQYINKAFPNGLFLHQKLGIQKYQNGANICLSTKTASGKSVVFFIAGIEEIIKNDDRTILALYPQKALGREQEEKWKDVFNLANLGIMVGRIDGGVSTVERPQILKNSNILIATPDVVHAWFLSNLNNSLVLDFIKRLSLIVVDEIHEYSGVFGSNAAFLFRRVQHIKSLLGGSIQFICASATIFEPELHLKRLFGQPFEVIGEEFDTSPKQDLEIQFVNPPSDKDLLTAVSHLLCHLSLESDIRFIAFVDSRKQTEHIASIASREQEKEYLNIKLEEFTERKDIRGHNILPYRAGYEEHDRRDIQERLSEGKLAGVISTSALELGIDIPYLNTGVLIGVPHSSTSLHQRIGRVGRQKGGKIIIINTKDVYDEAMFREPKKILERPLAQGALYLENKRIQYIHALCLARRDGEHDQVKNMKGETIETKFESNIEWPDGFLELCNKERVGEIPIELQVMKSEAGDDPNHAFPLRDVETQFKIEYKTGPLIEQKGSVSYTQLLRETYPGAVYFYITQPYRVYRVMREQRTIRVRNEKRYYTRPSFLPTLVFPNLKNIYDAKKYEDLIVIECNLQIRESICGFKERRGIKEIRYNYPLNGEDINIFYNQSSFAHTYFTTGVIFSHPSMNQTGINLELLAGFLFEAFLMIIPFERRDINFAYDKFRVNRDFIKEGGKFLTVYDQTYGSLRLTAKLTEDKILKATFEKCLDLLKREKVLDVEKYTLFCMKDLYSASRSTPNQLVIKKEETLPAESPDFEKIIIPGSRGLDIRNDNQEFEVEGVFYHPKEGLVYTGRHSWQKTEDYEDVKIRIPFDSLKEIPGVSKIGLYDYNTGEIKEIGGNVDK